MVSKVNTMGMVISVLTTMYVLRVVMNNHFK